MSKSKKSGWQRWLPLAIIAIAACETPLEEMTMPPELSPFTQEIKTLTESEWGRYQRQGREAGHNFKGLEVDWAAATDETDFYTNRALEVPAFTEDQTTAHLGELALPFSKTYLVAFEVKDGFSLKYRRLWARTAEELEEMTPEKFGSEFSGLVKYYALDGTYLYGGVIEHGNTRALFEPDGTPKYFMGSTKEHEQGRAQGCTEVTTIYYVDVITPYGTITKEDYRETTTVCTIDVDDSFGGDGGGYTGGGGNGTGSGTGTDGLVNVDPPATIKNYDDAVNFPKIDWNSMNDGQRAAHLISYIRWCYKKGIPVDVTKIFGNLPSHTYVYGPIRAYVTLNGQTFLIRMELPVEWPRTTMWNSQNYSRSFEDGFGNYYQKWGYYAYGDQYSGEVCTFNVLLQYGDMVNDFLRGNN